MVPACFARVGPSTLREIVFVDAFFFRIRRAGQEKEEEDSSLDNPPANPRALTINIIYIFSVNSFFRMI